jgi:hypothetical protein
MTSFTFEYALHGEPPLIHETIDLDDDAAIWCHVEALALRVGERPGAFIRVKDDKGHAVVRTGVVTALASIEQCACGSCTLKDAARAGPAALAAFRPSPCRDGGPCACKSFEA